MGIAHALKGKMECQQYFHPRSVSRRRPCAAKHQAFRWNVKMEAFYYFYQPGVPTGRVFSSHRDVWLVEKTAHANSFHRNDWCIPCFWVKDFFMG